MKITFITEGVSGGTDTNTNIANADLTNDGAHLWDLNNNIQLIAHDSGFESSLMMSLFGSGANQGRIGIGTNTDLYLLPLGRAAAQYDVITATDASGATSFQTPKIEGGKAIMMMSGSVGTFDSTNYAWFKKNGGGMHEDTNLTLYILPTTELLSQLVEYNLDWLFRLKYKHQLFFLIVYRQ